MKRYVLNIDRMCCGRTANAMVLRQVDEELPILLPSVPDDCEDLIGWIRKCQDIHPTFKPPVLRLTLERLNECIVDFNLELQEKFKQNGHDELYFMDDTLRQKPTASLDDVHATYSMEKTYLHALNGRADVVVGKDEDENDIIKVFNSSQLNVLFPFKKMSSKSMYASQLTVESAKDIDDLLEKSRGITLQGRCSF